MTYDNILTKEHGDAQLCTGVVTLHRPKQLNSLDDGLMDDMGTALRAYDADDAIGCIIAADKLMDEALAAAAVICGLSLPSVMMAKESVNRLRAFEASLTEGVRFERRLFHSLFVTADQQEGMDAFLAKRKPAFKHC